MRKYQLNVAPKSTPRPRKGRWGNMYSPPSYTKYMESLCEQIIANNIPAGDYSQIEILFNFGYPKSTKKSEKIHKRPHRKKPDCDNLAKAVLDALVKSGIVTDDCMLNVLKVQKQYTIDEPSIELSLG